MYSRPRTATGRARESSDRPPGSRSVESLKRRKPSWATRPATIGVLAVVLALVFAGCGSGQETAPGTAAPADVGDGAVANALPDLSVSDLATGEPMALQSLVPADRPVLLWFWAPH